MRISRPGLESSSRRSRHVYRRSLNAAGSDALPALDLLGLLGVLVIWFIWVIWVSRIIRVIRVIRIIRVDQGYRF